MSSPHPLRRTGGARSAVAVTAIMAFGFFDGVFLGAPIALLAATSRPVAVYCSAVIAVGSAMASVPLKGWIGASNRLAGLRS